MSYLVAHVNCYFLKLFLQHEAKLNTLTLNLRDVESKKRILEEAVDTLNEEIAGLKAKGDFMIYIDAIFNSFLLTSGSFYSVLKTNFRRIL